jgi:hypothetical protein
MKIKATATRSAAPSLQWEECDVTRPWTVKRPYRRIATKQPIWSEYYCSEDNHHVQIGNENYVISGDGYLLPVRKGQPAPNLKYFDK